MCRHKNSTQTLACIVSQGFAASRGNRCPPAAPFPFLRLALFGAALPCWAVVSCSGSSFSSAWAAASAAAAAASLAAASCANGQHCKIEPPSSVKTVEH